MKNEISIVIPTYNRSEYLKLALDSVLSQQTQELGIEVIVVDDASTDNTVEILREYEKKHAIRWLRNTHNKGGAISRNSGAALATKKYITFVDSDVKLYPGKLLHQVKLLEKSNDDVVFVYCKSRKEVKGGWKIDPPYVESGYIYDKLLYMNMVDTSSAVIKKEKFDEVYGFDPELPRFQDWDLFLRISKLGKAIAEDNVLYDSYLLSEAISSDDYARVVALERIVKKNNILSIVNNKIKCRFLLKLFNSYLLVGEHGKAKEIRQLIIRNECLDAFKAAVIAVVENIPKSMYKKLFMLYKS